jgi:hypothetical protein
MTESYEIGIGEEAASVLERLKATSYKIAFDTPMKMYKAWVHFFEFGQALTEQLTAYVVLSPVDATKEKASELQQSLSCHTTIRKKRVYRSVHGALKHAEAGDLIFLLSGTCKCISGI